MWAVPAGCGAWIPAAMRHALEPTPTARVRTLYIYGSRKRSGAVLELSSLLSAVVDHIHQHGSDQHLVAVLLDQLAKQRELPLFLPRLRSPIAQQVADALV